MYKRILHFLIFFFLDFTLTLSIINAQNNTWEKIGLPSSYYSSFSTIVFVSSKGTIFVGNEINLYKSTNIGLSWICIKTSFILSSLVEDSKGNIFFGGYTGLFRSSNEGDDWQRIDTDLKEAPYPTISNPNPTEKQAIIKSISIDSLNNLYIGSQYGYVFRSTNNGDTWIKIFTPNRDDNGYSIIVNRKGDVFYGAYSGIYRSTDKGKTWNSINKGFVSSPLLSIIDNGNLLIGSYEKILVSSDNGNNWYEINNGLPKGDYINSIFQLNKGIILAGTTKNGIYRSLDSGKSWQKSITAVGNEYVRSFSINSKGEVLASTSHGVQISSDNGDSFDLYNFLKQDCLISCLSQNYEGILFAGTESGVYRSTNDGNSWEETGLKNYSTSKIFVSPKNVIYAITKSGMFRSENNGYNWRYINTDFDIASGYYDFDANGNIYVGSNPGIHFSKDLGESWTKIGLDFARITGFGINKLNGFLFAGSMVVSANGSLFRSTDNGLNWSNTTLLKNILNKSQTQKILGQQGGIPFSKSFPMGLFLHINKLSQDRMLKIMVYIDQ